MNIIIDVGNAVGRYINQESPSIMRLLRIATRPNLMGSLDICLHQMARNIFAEAMEELAEEEGKDVPDLLAEENSEDGEFLSADDKEHDGSSALRDHIQCSGVLKKRKRKMRRQKHKKRLRKNRYRTENKI